MINETILEYVGFDASRRKIDKENGVVRDVKILGTKSRNNRVYPAETLTTAAPLYENAKVNVNHPDGSADESRKYQDRVGSIKNVRVETNGLYGDFYFNPKHPLAEQLVWDAERAPENLGFSHNVEARVRCENGIQIVEEIKRVRSVDVVADPATTSGLFESLNLDKSKVTESSEIKKRDVEIATLKEERDLVCKRFEIARRLLEKIGSDKDSDATRLAFKNSAFLSIIFETKNIDAAQSLIDERIEFVRETLGVSNERADKKTNERGERIFSKSRDEIFETNVLIDDFAASIRI